MAHDNSGTFGRNVNISDQDLNKNSSFLSRLGKGGRGSHAIAPTGATSGANILTNDVSGGIHTRKHSIQHFSSGLGEDSANAPTHIGSKELLRDPSVQMNLHENLYIGGSKENLAKNVTASLTTLDPTNVTGFIQ